MCQIYQLRRPGARAMMEKDQPFEFGILGDDVAAAVQTTAEHVRLKSGHLCEMNYLNLFPIMMPKRSRPAGRTSTTSTSLTGSAETSTVSPNSIHVPDDVRRAMLVSLFELFSHAGLPPRVLQSPQFKDVCERVASVPALVQDVPAPKDFARGMHEYASELRTDALAVLKQCGPVTLIADGWTAKHSVLAVLGCGVDDNYERVSALLHFERERAGVPGEPGVFGAAAMANVLRNCGAELDVQLVMAGNAPDVKEAAVLVNDGLRNPIVDCAKASEFAFPGCVVHRANAVVRKVIPSGQSKAYIPTVVRRIRTIVSAHRYRDQPRNEGDEEGMEFIQDSDIRLMGTYYMLERFKQLRQPFRAQEVAEAANPCGGGRKKGRGQQLPSTALTAEEWSQLDLLLDILAPIKDFTVSMQRATETIGFGIHLANRATKSLTKLQAKYTEGMDAEEVQQHETTRLLQEWKKTFDSAFDCYPTLHCLLADPRCRPYRFDEQWACLKTLVDVPEAELEAFMHMGANPKKDPFEWWQENNMDFPEIAECLRRYLAFPPTSACVERLFSSAGRVLSERRSATAMSTLCDYVTIVLSSGGLRNVHDEEEEDHENEAFFQRLAEDGAEYDAGVDTTA